ncbi:MAG: hypothetical protein QOE77_56 [Blastocatellia bacterium]|jgi:hypothetical protein|nr:hypothetical protein [Blastocatellia bacterium]
MLHIHNGDSAAGIAKRSNLPGEHLAWREALICGPAPSGLPEIEWRQMRAHHLAEAYDLSAEDCEKSLRDQDEALAKFVDHEEVVLWFEHDLFCQLHLLYLLNWFSQRTVGSTKLSLICINEFPGISDFHGLGELTSEQLASLFPQRHEVTAAEMEVAIKGWAAYSSADPGNIAHLIAGDIAALPFLRAALQKHLARFPWTLNGLGLIENVALALIAKGAAQFDSLFQKFSKGEPTYGLGDAQLLFMLRQLASGPEPVLTISKGASQTATANPEIRNTRLALTPKGESVRRGNNDFVALNGIESWLGGVHLSGSEAAWRWDEARGELRAKR